MGFLHPELLLLLLPALLLLRRARHEHAVTRGIRSLVAALIVVALAGPFLRLASRGRDLVIVVDRSRSMPAGATATAIELIELAEASRRSGDRIGVVTFGAAPVIERLPSASARIGGFDRAVDVDGSDLGLALATALDLLPEGRAGSIVLLSDGAGNGRDPLPVAMRAFARNVPIHVRSFERPQRGDLSVTSINLPESVAVGEPFQFTVWVRSDRRVESQFELERDGQRLSSGRRVFEVGMNRVVLRDVLGAPGVATYRVAIAADDDRIPENNQGVNAVLVRGARAVLVLNDGGERDSLVQALAQASMPVAVAVPESVALDLVALAKYRAVIVENVAADRIGQGLSSLRDFVIDRGGGLLLTGGRASFGEGGYYLSQIEPILPVSMELRQEHRKQAIALAITMDRSGSMAAPVGLNLQKMDLANLGAAAAIELLAPIDWVGVIAVDSAAHTIQDLAKVEDRGALVSTVKKIRSMGGGIFVYTALLAAGKMLEHAEPINRHIILFADAADSEEQERCPELLSQFAQNGITVSVIALGSPTDKDADFLRQVALLGKGEIYFTSQPEELPRLFAHDTLVTARRPFVDQPTACSTLPDLFALGENHTSALPMLDGYNLTYLRPGAFAGAVTDDDYHAPVFAFHYQGLGRTAVFTGQIGGKYGQRVLQWNDFAGFFVTAVRWLGGQEEPDTYFPSVRREGRDAVIAVEVDDQALTELGSLTAVMRDTRGARHEVVLARVAANRFEGRYALESDAIVLGSVALPQGSLLTLPPLVLPHSPEFESEADPERGMRLLQRIALESGGQMNTRPDTWLRGEREGHAVRTVTRELMLAALGLLLLEIAGRRLQWWGEWRWPARVSAWVARRLRKVAPRPAPKPRVVAAPAAAASQASDAPPPTLETTATPSMASALERARKAAEKELGR